MDALNPSPYDEIVYPVRRGKIIGPFPPHCISSTCIVSLSTDTVLAVFVGIVVHLVLSSDHALVVLALLIGTVLTLSRWDNISFAFWCSMGITIAVLLVVFLIVLTVVKVGALLNLFFGTDAANDVCEWSLK